MASMGGMVSTAASPPPARRPDDEGEDLGLFADLVVSAPRRGPRRTFGLHASFAVHAVLLTAVVLVPIVWPEAAPVHPDYVKALLYDPPPPPPPPLPKGTAAVQKAQPAKPVAPDPPPEHKPILTADIPSQTPPVAEHRDDIADQFGSEHGSDFGMPEGMEEGVEGGVPGGVPGGVVGGVIGGTGDGAVVDYDQPPRLLRQTQPKYPQEAFVKKVEGTVTLEVLIDASGRVARARVMDSVPLLDQAAIQCVMQWAFSPAIKHGRPVPVVANIPVTFRIL